MKQFDTGRLGRNLRAVVDEVEEILQSMSEAATDRAGDLGTRAGRQLHDVRDRIGAIEAQTSRQLRRAGRQTQGYARRYPWQAVAGIAAVAVAAVMLSRRRR